MKKFFLVFVLFLQACVGTLVEKKAEVGILASKFPATNSAIKRIAVPSSSGTVVPGANPNFFVQRTPERILSELATLEFRKQVLAKGKYRVFSHPVHKVDYTVKVACSELVVDVAQAGGKDRVPMREAGTLITTASTIASSASAYLPGIGALIQNFEPLSGLALSRNKKERVGMLTIDVQILDRNGYILNSKSFPATFAVRVVGSGGAGSFSEYKEVAASKAQDAVRLAVEEALVNFETIVR